MLDTKQHETELSVVVTVVEGGKALARCLSALSQQDGHSELDVIVPYDDTIADVARLAAQFPRFKFLALGSLAPPGTVIDPIVEHELFDKRRAAGLDAAHGRLIGMLEDRGAPRSDWAQAMISEHAQREAAAIGGGVINVAKGAMNRAIFVCDYGRHVPPFAEGEAEYLTDINICYRRDALQSVRELWIERYQETAVNWALRDRGYRLWLSPKPVVLHSRTNAPISRTLSERLQWGRVFGIQRGRRWSRSRAWASAAAATMLPFLLLVRQSRLLLTHGIRPGEFLPTVGALMAVIPAWSLGEAIGYVQGAGESS
ncbi:MAG: hypothetical protein SGJ21_16990 [Alphaproteobacteria bacterium]|nr:hypothetical protein [Alphaproteobacteria bacterium]